MIKRILAWCIILAAVGVFLSMIAYALTTPYGRIALAAIVCIVLGIWLLAWAILEVTGW